MPRIIKKPTQRQIKNTLTFWAGGTDMRAPVKRGPQPENEANKDVAGWRNRQKGLVLERNKRRLATPIGYHEPIMLGWLKDGSGDWIGHQSVTITPAMVGKKVAVFVGIESKRRDGGRTFEAQDKFMDELRDAGGITGVARTDADCDELVRQWWERVLR